MPTAVLALQQAVYASLIANTDLTDLLGGPHVFDGAPEGAAFPYVTFGPASARDWSTGTDGGDELTLTLHVWSRSAGRREATLVMAALQTALHQADLDLDGHRLVSLRNDISEVRREADGETWHGEARFRALTERL